MRCTVLTPLELARDMLLRDGTFCTSCATRFLTAQHSALLLPAHNLHGPVLA